MFSHIQPIIDTLTLSVRYNASFAGMRDRVIQRDTGKKVEYAWKDESYFVPGYGIYLTSPDAKFGYGKIYFQPTAARLELVQGWLKECFGPAYVHCIHLQNIELAYDFYCETLLFSDYESLVPRVAARIVQKNAINPFVVALRGKRKRCGDGAVNGEFTCYLQSCEKRESSNFSSELDYKRKVAGKTIIYAKSIKDRSFLRIEIKMDDGKAKRCNIIFDPRKMGNLMDLPNLPFSKFWQFKEVDVVKFIEALCPIHGLKNFRHALWTKRLEQVVNAPVADKIRFMKIACRGSKKLKSAMKKCVKEMSFSEVGNTPLPNGFFIAWRKGSGPLPDDGELPEKIELVPFEHDPLPALPLKPVQKPDDDGIFRLVELPDGMRITQAQIAQNPPYRPVLGAKIKNPTKHMRRPKTAPSAACGDGPGPEP